MAETDRSAPASPDMIWRQVAERAIGASLDTLHSRSADGLVVAPLYPRAPTDPHQPWRPRSLWSVAQRVDHPDPEAAHDFALLDLEGGADALVLVGAASPYHRGFGLEITRAALDLAFDTVELDVIGLRIDAGPSTGAALASLAGLVADRRLTSAGLAIDVGFDPIGWRARLGTATGDDLRPILELVSKAGLAGTIVLADGRPWHEAGASEAQELATVLATAVAYLRRQDAVGLALDAARRNIALLLTADADVFLGLAKFRAMRRLWARVEAACGLDPRPVRLQAETSWRMMTRRDPWTNAMRTTAAVFAAGLGGADAIGVLPFTLPLGLPEAAARRLARNSQHVLLDEAHLAKVEDPAAGAGGFEALTDGLCDRAWTLFQDIEREGGIERAADSGALKRTIAETARARARETATLTRGIVGTTSFASLQGPTIAVLEVAARLAPEPHPTGMPTIRDAAPFEVLRDRAERLAMQPRVYLATLGTAVASGPRAAYAAHFFAMAGLAVDGGVSARDLAALVEDFAASGTTIACLCGTDDAYAETAATAAALRQAGALWILRVGRPSGAIADGARDCVDAVIHDGCDALHILGEMLESAMSPPATR